MHTKKYTKGFQVDHFDSVNDFNAVISTAKANESFMSFENAGISASHEKNNGYWTLTNTWEEAEQIMANGYKKGVEDMMNSKGGIKLNNNRVKIQRTVGMVGFAPHVPNAIIGLPKSMIAERRIQQQVKTIQLYYDPSASASVEPEDLARGGKNIMALVQYLEQKGYRVQLNCFYGVHVTSKTEVACTIKIKDFKQQLNALLISYFVTHPSFLRRHLFRWIETSKLTDYSSLTGGYGVPMYHYHTGSYNEDTMNECLRSRGVIGKNDYYVNAVGASSANTIEDMLKICGIKNV